MFEFLKRKKQPAEMKLPPMPELPDFPKEIPEIGAEGSEEMPSLKSLERAAEGAEERESEGEVGDVPPIPPQALEAPITVPKSITEVRQAKQEPVRTVSPAPRPFVPGPVRKMPKLRQQDVFVRVDTFRMLTADLKRVKSDLKQYGADVGVFEQMRNQEEKLYERWRKSMDDVQKKLIEVDKILFSKGVGE